MNDDEADETTSAPKRLGWFSGLVITCALIAIFAKIGENPNPSGAVQKSVDPCEATTAQKKAARQFIQSRGYDCRVVNIMCSMSYFVKDAEVHCNNGLYTFYLENHGGIWSVKAD